MQDDIKTFIELSLGVGCTVSVGSSQEDSSWEDVGQAEVRVAVPPSELAECRRRLRMLRNEHVGWKDEWNRVGVRVVADDSTETASVVPPKKVSVWLRFFICCN